MGMSDEFKQTPVRGKPCMNPECTGEADIGMETCWRCRSGIGAGGGVRLADVEDEEDQDQDQEEAASAAEERRFPKFPEIPPKHRCAACPRLVTRRTRDSERTGKYWAETCSIECDNAQRRAAAERRRAEQQAAAQAAEAEAGVTRAATSIGVAAADKKVLRINPEPVVRPPPVAGVAKSTGKPDKRHGDAPPKPLCARRGCSARVSRKARKPGRYWCECCSFECDLAWRAGKIAERHGTPVPPGWAVETIGTDGSIKYFRLAEATPYPAGARPSPEDLAADVPKLAAEEAQTEASFQAEPAPARETMVAAPEAQERPPEAEPARCLHEGSVLLNGSCDCAFGCACREKGLCPLQGLTLTELNNVTISAVAVPPDPHCRLVATDPESRLSKPLGERPSPERALALLEKSLEADDHDEDAADRTASLPRVGLDMDEIQRRVENAPGRTQMLSAVMCEHANEAPSGPCECPVNCYCKVTARCRTVLADGLGLSSKPQWWLDEDWIREKARDEIKKALDKHLEKASRESYVPPPISVPIEVAVPPKDPLVKMVDALAEAMQHMAPEVGSFVLAVTVHRDGRREYSAPIFKTRAKEAADD